MGKLHKDSQPKYITPGLKVSPVPEGEDHRDQARYHMKMIMGNRYVRIIDTKYKPAIRSLKLDISPEIISEDNYGEIFVNVVEALHETGQIANGETAVCITFPAGSIEVEVPTGGQA